MCDPYISCDKHESWESIFKRLIVEQPDGSLAIRTCCPAPEPPPVVLALELTWDDIANVPVADASSVSDWNTFFDLPLNGTPFTSVTVAGNVVYLYGGSGITLKESLFDDVDAAGLHLTSIVDNADCIVEAEYNAFGDDNNGTGCPILTTVNLPACLILGDLCCISCRLVTNIILTNATTIGNYCFSGCEILQNISIPACTDLGGTTGDDNVFNSIIAQTIAVTCPAALLTCNAGAPDGDLLYLMANNTVTINGVGALILGWDDIANVPVADSTSVSDWNTLFDLPLNGTPFTSVTVAGNTVYLYGGSGITLKELLFDLSDEQYHLITFVDNADCIITGGNEAFYDCQNITLIYLPALTTAGTYFIETNYSLTTLYAPLLVSCGEGFLFQATSLTTLDISSCTDLGGTTGDDNVFQGITAQTIAVTCHASLLTCNGGAPDGDLCTLNTNNTLTVNGAPLVGCP